MKTINIIYFCLIPLFLLGCLVEKEPTTELSKSDSSNSYQGLLDQVAEKEDPVLETPITPQVQKAGDYLSAKTAGILAYQWGYALVRMEETMREYIDVPDPRPSSSYRAPLNKMGWARTLPTDKDADIPTANNDTFYLSAVVDLTEPYILKTPDTNDRYYVVDVFDMYQELVSYIGRRTTGTKAGVFAIVPPNWEGELPKGIDKVVHNPTQKAWLWGRLHVLEGDNIDDLHKMQDQFELMSLSEYLGSPKTQSSQLPPMPKVSKEDSLGFYKKLAFAMSQNPVFEQDKALVGQFELIGLTPGNFDKSKLTKDQLRGLYDATLEAPLTIVASIRPAATNVNNWMWVTKLDDFGYSYALRSVVSGPYLGGQGEKEALYPIRYVDSKGEVLNGKNTYTIDFSKEPPVNAFWSLTMYDANNKLLVGNSINRFKFSSESSGLVKNEDGTFTITIQNQKPDNTDNWLPAPDGPFYLILRMYQPREEVLSMQYDMPEVVKQ